MGLNLSKLYLSSGKGNYKKGLYYDSNGTVVGDLNGLTKEAEAYLSKKYGKNYADRVSANMRAGHIYQNGKWRAFDKASGDKTATWNLAMLNRNKNVDNMRSVHGRDMFYDKRTGRWTYYNLDAAVAAKARDAANIKKAHKSIFEKVSDAYHDVVNKAISVPMLMSNGNGQMAIALDKNGLPYYYDTTIKNELGRDAVMATPLLMGAAPVASATSLATGTVTGYGASQLAGAMGATQNELELIGDAASLVGGYYGAKATIPRTSVVPEMGVEPISPTSTELAVSKVSTPRTITNTDLAVPRARASRRLGSNEDIFTPRLTGNTQLALPYYSEPGVLIGWAPGYGPKPPIFSAKVGNYTPAELVLW